MEHTRETTSARPTWTWTNDMRKPSTIHVAPAFKDELGVVFIGIGDASPNLAEEGWSGEHRGIWLTRELADRLVQAVQENAAWAETHGEDDED
jgi:hypothetical protein